MAKALSTPLCCHWQTKARAQQRCCAWPCGMQEGLERSPFAALSQSSSASEVHQQKGEKSTWQISSFSALLSVLLAVAAESRLVNVIQRLAMQKADTRLY